MTQRIRDDVERHAQGVGGFEALAVEFLSLLMERFAHGLLDLGGRGQPVIRLRIESRCPLGWGRCGLPLANEPVVRLRFDPRCQRQNLPHLLRTSATRAAANVRVSVGNGNALGEHGGDKRIDLDAILAGEGLKTLADGIGNGNAQGAHGVKMVKNWAGVTMEIPSVSAPRKSFTL